MLKCPVCGYDNLSGALVCADCYSLLVDVKLNTQETTLPQREPGLDVKPLKGQRQVDVSKFGANIVALYFDGFEQPLIVHITDRVILGRSSTEPLTQPRIDLRPYGAFEKGVSRAHALLRRMGKDLTIEDLDSSNGTWLNGERLPGYKRLPIKSGDNIMLARLSFQIYST